MGSKIKIVSWNVNGLRARKNEVLMLINELEPDIIAIQETKMTVNDKITFPQYNVYRYDKQIPRGGVAILVNRGLDHAFIKHEETEIDGVTIDIRINNYLTRITSAYKPPNDALNELDIIDLLDGRQPKIITGDLNCKNPIWNSTVENRDGTRLQEYVTNLGGIVIGPEEPTYLPSARGLPQVLDIVIMKNITQDFALRTLNQGTSDHNPILLEIGTGNENKYPIRKNKTDWNKFRNQVKNNITINQSIITMT